MLELLEREAALAVAKEATQILIMKRNSIVVIMPVLVTVSNDTQVVHIIIPPELSRLPLVEHPKLLQVLHLLRAGKVNRNVFSMYNVIYLIKYHDQYFE